MSYLQAIGEHDKRIGKKLSYLLRHGAVKEGLHIQPDGYVDVQEVLRKLPGITDIDIVRIVQNNDKQRFSLCKANDTLMIKANQGHTITQIDCLSLKLLTGVCFDIIHGTYFDCYQKIKIQGLSRMGRNHIHFSKGLNFHCGLRKSAEVFIYIDFSKANESGLKFYESENGVILSNGNHNGFIEPKYFLKVVSNKGQDI